MRAILPPPTFVTLSAVLLLAAIPIPASGQVIGYTITDLGVFISPSNASHGNGINAAGQVAGSSNIGGAGQLRAFRTTATGGLSDPAADLGVLPLPVGFWTDSVGLAINSSGQVTGYCFSSID